jgi:hypothetical protein
MRNEMNNTYPLKRLGSQMVESSWWNLREVLGLWWTVTRRRVGGRKGRERADDGGAFIHVKKDWKARVCNFRECHWSRNKTWKFCLSTRVGHYPSSLLSK